MRSPHDAEAVLAPISEVCIWRCNPSVEANSTQHFDTYGGPFKLAAPLMLRNGALTQLDKRNVHGK